MRNSWLISYNQANKAGFRSKSLAGYRADLKAVCAKLGRMDLFRRVHGQMSQGIGTSAFRNMINIGTRGDAEKLERYIAAIESAPASPPAAVCVARLTKAGNIAGMQPTKARTKPALALTDPFAHMDEQK